MTSTNTRQQPIAKQGEQSAQAASKGPPAQNQPPKAKQGNAQKPVKNNANVKNNNAGKGKPAGNAKNTKAAKEDDFFIPETARPAKLRRRHWGLFFSFVLLVAAPIALTGGYLWTRAVDQYASTVGFTVRQEQGSGSADFLTGFAAQIGGGGGSSDTDILYAYIQSEGLVSELEDKISLREKYSQHYDVDPVFSLPPDASMADLVKYWRRIATISYDESSRLLELRILAFDPDTAQEIGREVLTKSQSLINDINIQARNDSLGYAQNDLLEAQERLRNVRTELIRFRTTNQLVDPESDLEGRMGVVNTLQGQLAEALIDIDLLEQSTNQNDPRAVQARRRVEVIRNRIADERRNVTSGEGENRDYPTLLAEYEALAADREFAEQSYLAALASLDVAKAEASRQSRYLATYLAPTKPFSAEYPKRWTLLGIAALFLLLSWSILSLIYYSIRDSR